MNLYYLLLFKGLYIRQCVQFYCVFEHRICTYYKIIFVLKNARKQGGCALLSGRCFIGKGAVRAVRGCRCKGQTTSSSCAERGTDLCRGCLWRVAPRCRRDADSHTIRDNPCRAGGHRSTR